MINKNIRIEPLQKKINIKKKSIVDVAIEAGVSVTTVSHVMNKTRYVKEETKKKVLKAIKKLDYVMSLNASSLRGKKTKLVGLIIPEVSNLFFAQLSSDLENVFFEGGYSLTLCNSEGNFKRELEYINILKSRDVDGIIIVPASDKYEHLKKIIDEGTFVISIVREIKYSKVDNIFIDGYNGAFKATKYLLDMGHTKIGFIRRHEDLYHSTLRFKGYIDALKEREIKIVEEFCPRATDFYYSGGYNAVKKIVDLKDKPTAIITHNNIIGIGAIKAIKDKGYIIPGDFSIISFDNNLINKYLETSLSSIAIPPKKLAAEVLKIFLNRLENNVTSIKKIPIKPFLKIRQSVAKI